MVAPAMVMGLKEVCEDVDPPLSIADHEEKTHLAGKTFGGPTKCEGKLFELVISPVCSTDCFTCLSPLKIHCYDAYAAVHDPRADYDNVLETVVTTGVLALSRTLYTFPVGLTVGACAGCADG